MPEPPLPSLDYLHDCAPSYCALVNWLAPRIDDAMLRTIAEADYGHLVEEHFQALLRIRDFVEIDAPIRWEPKEVLDLVRWSEPTDPKWFPDAGSRHDGHLQRAFCCAALLVAGGQRESQDYILSENETLVQLCSSVIALGPEACECAASLLAWRMLAPPCDEVELAFFGVAMLLLQIQFHPRGLSTRALANLCDWTIAAENAPRCDDRGGLPDRHERWLLGLVSHDQRHDAWEQVARDVLLAPPGTMAPALAEQVRGIGVRLLELTD